MSTKMRNGSRFAAKSACKHNLNCFGHRKFWFFFLLRAETISEQTSLFTVGERWRLAFDFLVYSKLTACLQPLPGTSCQNKASTDRWLGSCCIMAINISAASCNICWFHAAFCRMEIPKILVVKSSRTGLLKNVQLKTVKEGLGTTLINQRSRKMKLVSHTLSLKRHTSTILPQYDNFTDQYRRSPPTFLLSSSPASNKTWKRRFMSSHVPTDRF